MLVNTSYSQNIFLFKFINYLQLLSSPTIEMISNDKNGWQKLSSKLNETINIDLQ